MDELHNGGDAASSRRPRFKEGSRDRQRLVLAGAGHTHLYLFSRLNRLIQHGIDVTVVSPGPFRYSGMAPGVLGGRYRPGDYEVDAARLVQNGGGTWMEDAVTGIDRTAARVTLASGQTLGFDALSLNIGSEVPLEKVPGAAESAVPVKPVSGFARLRQQVRNAAGVQTRVSAVVVGGGPAGCEAAANLDACLETCAVKGSVSLVSSSRNLLSGYAPRAQQVITRYLEKRGIEILTGVRVRQVDGGRVMLDNSSELDADFVVMATGISPPRVIAGSDLAVAEDGALRVNEFLQHVEDERIFGGGDCIRFDAFPLARVGVYAVREAPVLMHNLRAFLGGDALMRFEPQRRFLLILNLGDGNGLLMWRRLVLKGRWVFAFKEWLDRRFIGAYQHQA